MAKKLTARAANVASTAKLKRLAKAGRVKGGNVKRSPTKKLKLSIPRKAGVPRTRAARNELKKMAKGQFTRATIKGVKPGTSLGRAKRMLVVKLAAAAAG